MMDIEEYDEDTARLEEEQECFTEEYLRLLTGTQQLETVQCLEVRIDAAKLCMDPLVEKLPRLTVMKVNNSYIPQIRMLGTAFSRVTVLWVSRSSVESLDGISAMRSLKELYASFNDINDVSPLVHCDNLEELDLEGNHLSDMNNLEYLGMCSKLVSLNVTSNPVCTSNTYLRRHIAQAIPHLKVLDDSEVDANDRKPIPANADSLPPKPPKRSQSASSEEMSEDAALLAQLQSDKEKAMLELSLVADGIKYAKVGIDDAETFVGVLDERQMDEMEYFAGRPLTRPSTAGSSYLASGSSAGSSRSRGGQMSESISFENAGEQKPIRRTSIMRPGSSAGMRPGTGGSVTSGFRPGSACGRPGTGGMGRPTTGGLGRPQSARPGSARPSSAHGRPGTASDQQVVMVESSQNLYWRSRRLGNVEKVDWADPGDDLAGDDRGSDLTNGAQSTLCGNPVRGLRSRKHEMKGSEGEEEDAKKPEEKADETSHEYLLESLKKWKVETLDLVLAPDSWGGPSDSFMSVNTSQEVDVFNNTTGEETHQDLTPHPPRREYVPSSMRGAGSEEKPRSPRRPTSASRSVRRSSSSSSRSMNTEEAAMAMKPPLHTSTSTNLVNRSMQATKPSSPRSLKSSSTQSMSALPPRSDSSASDSEQGSLAMDENTIVASKRSLLRSVSENVSSLEGSTDRKSRSSFRKPSLEDSASRMTDDRKARLSEQFAQKSHASVSKGVPPERKKMSLSRDRVEVEASIEGM